MPGFLLHTGAVVQCAHAAPAVIVPSQPRVLVNGQPVTTMASQITVAGCPLNVAGAPHPCVKIQWAMPAARVKLSGQPAAVVPSPGPGPGLCLAADAAPQGPPIVTTVQPRVIGM